MYAAPHEFTFSSALWFQNGVDKPSGVLILQSNIHVIPNELVKTYGFNIYADKEHQLKFRSRNVVEYLGKIKRMYFIGIY